MKMFKNAFYLLSIFCLISCGDDDADEEKEVVVIHETVTLEKVLRISEEEFTLNDKPAVLISTGLSQDKIVDISLYKSNINAEYSTLTQADSDPALVVAATWDEITFLQSSKHETNVNFEIVSLDPENLLGEIKISANLVNLKTGEILVINESKLEIGGMNFLALTGLELPE